jgi:uncharacterized protein (DUF302 family)
MGIMGKLTCVSEAEEGNLDEMNPLAVILACQASIGKIFLLRTYYRAIAIPTGLVMSATEMANKFFGISSPDALSTKDSLRKLSIRISSLTGSPRR